MRKVTLFTASRSERPLLDPIIKRAPKYNIELQLVEMMPNWSLPAYVVFAQDMLGKYKPDISLIPCDRLEMVPVAMASFYDNTPIAHLFAGIYGAGTHDDVARHVISMFSHILLCESDATKQNLVKAGEEEWRCHVVGATHFDDLMVDEFLVPKRSYDLVLINPLPLAPKNNAAMILRALGAVRHSPVIIYPNEDAGRDVIIDRITKYSLLYECTVMEESVPRPQFLGLLKNAKQFISNSSSTIYEAPHFGIKVYNPTFRNAERTPYTGVKDGHASERILKVLASVELNQKLLNKRLRLFGR